MEKEFEGKNIEFISISNDRKKDRWKKFVKRHKLTGNQFYIGYNKKFSNVFKVKYLPTFFMIGKDGRMLKSRIFRPSDPELKEFLMTLSGM